MHRVLAEAERNIKNAAAGDIDSRIFLYAPFTNFIINDYNKKIRSLKRDY